MFDFDAIRRKNEDLSRMREEKAKLEQRLESLRTRKGTHPVTLYELQQRIYEISRDMAMQNNGLPW